MNSNYSRNTAQGLLEHARGLCHVTAEPSVEGKRVFKDLRMLPETMEELERWVAHEPSALVIGDGETALFYLSELLEAIVAYTSKPVPATPFFERAKEEFLKVKLINNLGSPGLFYSSSMSAISLMTLHRRYEAETLEHLKKFDINWDSFMQLPAGEPPVVPYGAQGMVVLLSTSDFTYDNTFTNNLLSRFLSAKCLTSNREELADLSNLIRVLDAKDVPVELLKGFDCVFVETDSVYEALEIFALVLPKRFNELGAAAGIDSNDDASRKLSDKLFMQAAHEAAASCRALKLN